jgi:hypothetical protein
MFDLLQTNEELFVVENPLKEGLRYCPFRTGNRIASDCMIWIGKHDRTLNEDVGHCAIVKTHQMLAAMETLLTLIFTIVLIILIWLLASLCF